MTNRLQRRLAERVRRACIEAALQGYESAGISGLCHEGAWEAAVDAMRMLDLDALVAEGDEDDAQAEDQTGI